MAAKSASASPLGFTSIAVIMRLIADWLSAMNCAPERSISAMGDPTVATTIAVTTPARPTDRVTLAGCAIAAMQRLLLHRSSLTHGDCAIERRYRLYGDRRPIRKPYRLSREGEHSVIRRVLVRTDRGRTHWRYPLINGPLATPVRRGSLMGYAVWIRSTGRGAEAQSMADDQFAKEIDDPMAHAPSGAVGKSQPGEAELGLRLLVDSIPGLVATFTPGGEVEFVNRQVLE